MTLKPLFKFLSVIYPFAVGFTTMTVLQILYPELLKKIDIIQMIVLSIFVPVLVLIVLNFIGGILFGKRNDLATKMMKCSLRKQNGLNYCAECPESYTCPK